MVYPASVIHFGQGVEMDCDRVNRIHTCHMVQLAFDGLELEGLWIDRATKDGSMDPLNPQMCQSSGESRRDVHSTYHIPYLIYTMHRVYDDRCQMEQPYNVSTSGAPYL